MRMPSSFRIGSILLCGLLAAPFVRADDTREDRKHPVEDPGRKQPTAEDGPAPHGEWSLRPAWHKGSDLSQVGYLVRPAGITASVGGRVMAIALMGQGKYLVAKTDSRIALLDAGTMKVLQQLEYPAKDGGTMHGLAVSADGATAWVTTQGSRLVPFTLGADGKLAAGAAIDLKVGDKNSCPLGVALGADGQRAYVALATANRVGVVDLKAGRMVASVPVGICPYGVALTPDGKRLFVSNFGGSPARPGERTEVSAGTPVPVDPRSVALRGTLSVLALPAARVQAEIPVRIHPEAMVMGADGKRLYVVDAGGDGVSEIDTARAKVVRTHDTRPDPALPYGSLSNGIALSPDGRSLLTANAGHNALALIPLDGSGTPAGFIPAGGYPGAVCAGGDALYIGNVLGFRGDLQRVPMPRTPAELQAHTEVAERCFHLPEMLRALERSRAGARAPLRPVPARVGDPSPIRHVVYVIKENKKFDQVLGDIGRGNCDPSLVEFGRATTPNIHAIADQFVLLDNYYCNGILSADGHQHATQGLTSPYREKDWANVRCTYDFGIDPLCYAGCGFIWDQVLRAGLSFRNFGELDYPVTPKGRGWRDHFADWKAGKPGDWKVDYKLEALRRYSDPAYPGWCMAIPDQARADVFLRALAGWEKAGAMPNFTVIYLPNDHTQGASKGWPTPRAYVADNDLATGRILEGLSKSRFWPQMAVFINEDDPQTGADHVDGHRSYCLVAGPHVKRGGQVVSRFYNQSSVLHTIGRILGLPPLNQAVAAAPLMDECFQDTPDLRPYACLPAQVPLDELNGDQPVGKTAAALAPKTVRLDFSGPDRIDADALMFSRWSWATVHGERPFPEQFFGAHGKGLAALGLRLDPDAIRAEEEEEEEDEDE